MTTLVIDNIDSFVYNLVQYVGILDDKPLVFQNTINLKTIKETIKEKRISHIIISPGPKRPEDAGISNKVIKKFGIKIPILGVCLGHQCIGYTFNGKIRNAKLLRHGKTSLISHDNNELFTGMKNPFEATRYHSLVVDSEQLPNCLEVIATSLDDHEVMALKHRKFPIYGVQFHPESILTKNGIKIIKNFLDVL